MNRDVMVTRGDPDARELKLSAKGICSDKKNDPVKDRLAPYFKPLAEAFKGICKKQKRIFRLSRLLLVRNVSLRAEFLLG